MAGAIPHEKAVHNPGREQAEHVLREIVNVRQVPGEGRRRWFESDDFDLIVWFDASGAVSGFQICYDLGKGGEALTWRPGGFAHAEIDAGDSTPLKNQTPILVAGGAVPWGPLARRFDACSGTLEPALREFIATRLLQRPVAT
jgi:hypothetical protein